MTPKINAAVILKNTYKASHTGEKRIIYEHSELLEATLNQRLMARRLLSLRRRGNVFRFALFHAGISRMLSPRGCCVRDACRRLEEL